jgi:pilus assembly protein Flp/PilA
MEEEKCATPPIAALARLTKEWAMRGLTEILRCERGATAIEYALVAALISIAALAAMQGLGNKINTMYNNVSNHLD